MIKRNSSLYYFTANRHLYYLIINIKDCQTTLTKNLIVITPILVRPKVQTQLAMHTKQLENN